MIQQNQEPQNRDPRGWIKSNCTTFLSVLHWIFPHRVAGRKVAYFHFLPLSFKIREAQRLSSQCVCSN